MKTKKATKKSRRGPKPGEGGRPPGPKRINLGTVRVLEHTATWLNTRGQTASQALDDLSGSNETSSATGVAQPASNQ